MYRMEVTVHNPSGLHARPAAALVAAAKKLSSPITIRLLGSEEPPVSARSTIRLLSLGVSCGDTVEIAAEGEDERAAVETLAALIESGFGE